MCTRNIKNIHTPPLSPGKINDGGFRKNSLNCVFSHNYEREINILLDFVISDTRRKNIIIEKLNHYLIDNFIKLSVSNLKLGVLLGKGSHLYVYQIESNHVIKIPQTSQKIKFLINELYIYYHLNINELEDQGLRNYGIIPLEGICMITNNEYCRLKEEEMVPCLIMKRSRCTLKTFILQHNISKQQWWEFAKTLLKSLNFLMNKGCVHGDIKTDNIIIIEGNEILLADFTSSFLISDQHKIVPELMSTLNYCHSDLINMIKLPSFETDLYSVGLCLLSCITGFEPFSEVMLQNPRFSFHWLINAISQNDPIRFNILDEKVHCEWLEELIFLQKLFQDLKLVKLLHELQLF